MSELYQRIISRIIFVATKLHKQIKLIDLKYMDYNQLEHLSVTLNRELYGG